MGLKEITKEDIERIAAYDLVLSRGFSYYKMGAVKNILVDDERIRATVEGSRINEYKVEIWCDNRQISARCTCPFDGWACKHIIAVLYEFLQKKETLFKEANLEDDASRFLRKNLLKVSKERLIRFILQNARKNPETKTELLEFMHKYTKDKKIFISLYHNYWQNAEPLLREMNELGGTDIENENIVIDNLNKIVLLTEKGKLPDKIKKEFIEKLFYYYSWGNCGFTDFLREIIFEIPSTKGDWEFVIEKFKENDTPYKEDYIMEIRRNILEEDEEAYLK